MNDINVAKRNSAQTILTICECVRACVCVCVFVCGAVIADRSTILHCENLTLLSPLSDCTLTDDHRMNQNATVLAKFWLQMNNT